MHHECFIKAFMIDFSILGNLPITNMQHRTLRERSQQFMGGLGGEHDRRILFFSITVHPITPGIHLVEAGIAVPGFIKVEVLGQSRKRIFYEGRIVTESIVGGVGQHGHRQLVRSVSIDQRTFFEFGAYRCFGKLFGRDRADNAMSIAGGNKINRNRSDHLDDLLQRFMAIAVHKHHVTGADPAVPDDLVGGRGAIEHKISTVRAKSGCGVAFSLSNHTAVFVQRTEFGYGDGKICTEYIFSIKVKKEFSGRAPQKSNTAHMPRRMPGVVIFFGVMRQRTEKRRH